MQERGRLGGLNSRRRVATSGVTLPVLRATILKVTKRMSARDGAKKWAGYEKLIESLFERAHGTLAVRETQEHGRQVYDVLPDPQAAKILLEFGFGKATESIEMNVKETDPMRKMPFMIIIPPSANERGGVL
jgi:hypothetical protein